MTFVCLLWKSFIFDILGVSGDGLLSAGPEGNLQSGRVRLLPGSVSLSLSPGLGARSPGLSWRLALHPCGLSALLAWALASSLGQKPRCGWSSFLGEGQSWPLGLPAQERVVFGSLEALPVLNWISGPPLA